MTFNELKLQINLSYNFKTRPHIWHTALTMVKDDDICLEFGVYTGHSINYMSSVKPDNKFFGFDSFDGLPVSWNAAHPVGHFKTDFLKLKFNNNIQIKMGLFGDSIPEFLLELRENICKIKFIHIDCDIYSSTKIILDLMGDIIKHNKCILLFDEFYNYNGFENHEFLAFLEFINSNSIKYKIIGKNINHQQVLIQII